MTATPGFLKTLKTVVGKKLRGIRDSMPQGYLLGRASSGNGPPELIAMDSLLAGVRGAIGGIAANPTAVASDVAVNGTATTFMRSDAAPAIQKTSATAFGLAKVDGTSITAAGGVISTPNSGTVKSVGLTMPTEFAVAGSPITTTGTLAVSKALQAANAFYAGPASGASAAPTFRSVVSADLPGATFGTVVLSGNVTPSAGVADIGNTANGNAFVKLNVIGGNITSFGTAAAQQLRLVEVVSSDGSQIVHNASGAAGTISIAGGASITPVTGDAFWAFSFSTAGVISWVLYDSFVAGSIALSKIKTTQNANTFWAGPVSGAATTPAFRGMSVNDPVSWGFAAGSIPFMTTTGIAQNNGNLFWDNVNNRLGIGTTIPAQSLEVNGGDIQCTNAGPDFQFLDTGGATDQKLYDFRADIGTFIFRFINDASNVATTWFQVTRSGITPGPVTFPESQLGVALHGAAPSMALDVGGPLGTLVYTVATLPPATLKAGMFSFVNDATLSAITGLGLAPTGGGTNFVPVYSDGAGWKII